MVSLGTQPSNNPKFKPNFKVVLQFELPNELISFPDGTQKPMATSHFLTAYLGSVNKPSKTNLFLTAWRGRAFTEKELGGFDLAAVVGAPCLLNIIHETKDGKTRDRIASVSPLPKGMKVVGMINEPVKYEIEQGRDAVFAKLPEWMRKMIELCEEWTHPAAAQCDPEPADQDGDNVDNDVSF
jgi:hypothetical protein